MRNAGYEPERQEWQVLDGYNTSSSFVNSIREVQAMDKIVSTIILIAVSIALAVALSTYYAGFVNVFMRYEEISFDLAYAAMRDGEAEIVLNFRNTGQGVLTVVAIEINGADLEPTGNNPFPLELPYGTNAKLRLHASPEIFVSGVAYEVAIRTDSGRTYSKMVVMP